MAIFAEYIWIDGTSPTQTLRSKTRVLPGHYNQSSGPSGPSCYPPWGFDGSSTGQADGGASDCALRPVRVFPDPLRLGNLSKNYIGEVVGHVLILCEVMNPDGTPHPSNARAQLRAVVNRDDAPASMGSHDECWFGLEQEYTLFQGSRPLGFPAERRFPAAQGPYYCGVGADEVYGRDLVEAHLNACVAAGIKISGINAEVMPGQWEFQVGPLPSLEVGDHLWVARWLLYRLGENYGIHATLDPKPVPGEWNGAGMHANFSTAAMRAKCPKCKGRGLLNNDGTIPPWNQDGVFNQCPECKGLSGMAAIEAWCHKASKHVKGHLAVYGEGIEMRLTGRNETCSYKDFRWGVSDRGASIRIPMDTANNGHGYLEDRRPNANACPYEVAAAMLKTDADLWGVTPTAPQHDPADTCVAAPASQ